jgi:hypothetical protein
MSAGRSPSRAKRRLPLAALVIASGLMIFAGANAHLILVAVDSQPDCVLQSAGPDGGPAPLRAAKPSC